MKKACMDESTHAYMLTYSYVSIASGATSGVAVGL